MGGSIVHFAAPVSLIGRRTATPSRLASKFLSGWVSTLVSGVVMFVSYRSFLRYLGYERYGLWLVLATVLNVLQLGSVGIGPALTRLVAQQSTSACYQAIQRYLFMSVSIVIAPGLALTAVLAASSKFFVLLFHLPLESSGQFLTLLPIMALLSVYAVIVDLFVATLSGLGRIDLGNYAQLLSQMIGNLISVMLLTAGFGLPGLLCGTAVSLVVLHGMVLLQISRLMPLRVPGMLDWNVRDLRTLLSFGGWVAGTTVANACIGPLTRICLTRYSGLASVAAYDLAYSASYKIRSLWECAMRALLPEVSRLISEGGEVTTGEVRAIYLKACRVLLAGATPMYAAAFVLAPPILRIWIGMSGEASVAALRILLAATFVNLMAAPSYYLLMGLGRVRHCFLASCLMATVSMTCAGVAIYRSHTLPLTIASASFLLGTSCLTIYVSAQAKQALKIL